MTDVLVTGGCGFIGSHAVLCMIEAGYRPIILDNFSNSHRGAHARIEALAGQPVTLVEGDIRDGALLESLFSQYAFSAVFHFAGLKSVGESVREPLAYYDCNVTGTLSLLAAMQAAGVKRLVFSSSATVYAPGVAMPVSEDASTGPINPYGQSKLMVEQILRDHCAADPQMAVALLRYFNPTGAHPSGQLGESPNGVPENLVPYVAQVATGVRDKLTVFGDDYDTADGTGERDYIHVVDLAEGHVAALRYLESHAGSHVWNLGTGTGYTVLQLIAAFEKASERTVSYEVGPRRPGDVGSCYANTDKASQQLGWQARFGLEEMMVDMWRWQSGNPDGY